MAIYRFASDATNTYVRIPPAPFVAGDLAVELSSTFPFWPRILSENLGPGSQPRYIWATNPVSDTGAVNGEVQFFGRSAAFTNLVLGATLNLPFNVSFFADNAFRARLRISVVLGGVLTTVTEVDIPDGNLTLDTGLVEVAPPYRWQNITTFSGEALLPIGTTALRFDLEIEAVNYAQAGGTPETNPAGIQFLLELSNLPEGLTVVNTVPLSLFV